jgi:Carboxypeptidase regulatory-like domain/TonB dependent receptor/TonB-dependent Receptor Plug Domain
MECENLTQTGKGKFNRQVYRRGVDKKASSGGHVILDSFEETKMKLNMTKKLAKALLSLAMLGMIMMSSAMLAQSTTQGGISGTVFDATGAVIGNATVTIRNNSTNSEQLVTSDSSGNFKAPLVEPGTYTVLVAASGFEGYQATSVVVQVGQVTTVEPHMTTGAASQVVEVTAGTPILNFDSPDFSSVINQTALANVPINNRRWSALALTTPGVVADSSGFGLVSVRGISTLLNNVMIDGADDNQAYYAEERGRTREAYSTSGSAVQEFQMNTGVYAAEYGRAAGGVINSVTKSGGNQLHGEAYFYDRESNWNAFNNYTVYSPPPTFISTHVKPEDVRKIYGFTVGGALIKDKLFWMYTYDQHSHIFPAISTPSIPSTFYLQPDAALSGSQVCVASGATAGEVTGNPASGTTSATDQQVCTMAVRLGMTYAAAASYFSSGLTSLTTDLGLIPRTGYQEINTPKLDWQVNSKEHVSVLYHRLRWDSPGGVQTQNPVFYGVDTTGTDFVKLDYGVAKLTSLIKPSISNEILYQYGRELNDEGQTPFSSYTKNNLVSASGNVPEVVFASTAGSLTFGSPYYSYRIALPDERKWQVEDTLYYSHGNHSFKFGVDLLHNADLINNTFESNGVFSYGYISNYLTDLYLSKHGASSGVCNSSAAQAYATSTGSVAGQPGDTFPCYTSFVQGFGNPVFAMNTFDYGVFAQDNWKFSPRLTLELGLRYDQEIIPAQQASYVNPAVPQTANKPTDKNNFGPRVGFSWDTFGTGKTLLRGGFGMYYGRLTNGVLLNAQLNTAAGPAQYTTSFKPAATASVPGGPAFPNIVGAGPAISPSVEYLDSHLQDPMVEEYDLVAQQALGKGTVFSVSYLGAMGRELTNFLDLNLNPTQTSVTITVADSTGKGPLGPTGKQYIVPTFTSYKTAGTSFGAITDVVSNINSSYNAFVAEVQNHTLHSVQFDVNYTWAHALDYNQGALTTTSTTNWLDPYANPRSNYGNSSFNIPNRLVGWAVYNLPNFVHSKNWASFLTNDWSVSNSFQALSGLPISMTPSGSNSTSAVLSGWNGGGDTAYIPIIGRNTFKYPRHIVDDLRVQKGIVFKERYRLELLCNVFNVANHQNVDGLNTTGYSFTGGTATASTATYNTSFGTVSSSNSSGFLYTPRQLEVAAKFSF